MRRVEHSHASTPNGEAAFTSKIETMQLTKILFPAACLAMAGCASMPAAPANAPSPLPVATLLGDLETPYSAVIEAIGAPDLTVGAVAAGDTLLTFRYRYLHTAVLTEDVIGYSITVPGVQAPAGSPGYFAGAFLSSGPYLNAGVAELWCFLPGVVGGRRDIICLLKNQPGVAAIAPTRLNPYLWDQFAPATGTFDYVHTPIYERRTVQIPGDLAIEYRFRGWTRTGARVELRAVGREVETPEIPANQDGRILLRTVAGTYSISRGTDPLTAAILPMNS